MASSKVMATTIPPANPDLPRQSASSSTHFSELQTDPSKNFGSMNMDELLKNIYADSSDAFPAIGDGAAAAAAGLASQGSFSLPKSVGNKTVDEVWKEIVSGSGGGENRGEPEMTLEDFLTKAGAVREEDVVRLSAAPPRTGYVVDSVVSTPQFSMQAAANAPGSFGVEAVGFGSGIVAVGAPAGGGRGKRRVVEEPPVDRATQQKQRRMIKNRESAARSRERKQAYTVELESLVTQLEEENARLMREEAEQTRVRFKQLMENLIPVVEKRRPPRVLRRMNSL